MIADRCAPLPLGHRIGVLPRDAWTEQSGSLDYVVLLDGLPLSYGRSRIKSGPYRIPTLIAEYYTINGGTKHLEIVCWLRLQLLTLTNMVLEQTKASHRTAWNQTWHTVEAKAAEELLRHQRTTERVVDALDDALMSAEDFRAFTDKALRLLAPDRKSISRASLIRQEMTSEPVQLRRFLKLLDSLNLEIASGHPLDLAMGTLRQVYTKGEEKLDLLKSLPFAAAASLPIRRSLAATKRLATFEIATACCLNTVSPTAISVHGIA